MTGMRRCVATAAAVLCALAAGVSAPARAGVFASPRPGDAGLTAAQRAVLVEATREFRDVRRALRAGYLPTKDCVPGMGLHYVHPGRAADADIDPVLPEILLYVPGRDGRPRLAGLEFFRADADGDVRTDKDRPTLFGHGFDGPMAGHPVPHGAPPMPVHYDLHVWLYLPNRDGVLATENPDVGCP